jgi:hypothetical protein
MNRDNLNQFIVKNHIICDMTGGFHVVNIKYEKNYIQFPTNFVLLGYFFINLDQRNIEKHTYNWRLQRYREVNNANYNNFYNYSFIRILHTFIIESNKNNVMYTTLPFTV